MAQISLAKKYVAKKHQDYSNNHILLIYLMSGRKSTLKNTRKTKIKQTKRYDIRLSEQKLYHYKEVNGKYYGAEIPKEIHYTEYFRYLYFNVKYEFSEKTYYRSIPYTDKDKQESIWDRERCFVAQEISEWRVDELEDWQRDLIEKIRVGVELKDDDIVKAMGY